MSKELTFGRRVQLARYDKGLTLKELSAKSGLWSGTIIRIEKGMIPGSPRTRSRLIDILDLNSPRTYTFIEPHVTGGTATVEITEEQIIKYMRNKNKGTDEELINEFVAVHRCKRKKMEEKP